MLSASYTTEDCSTTTACTKTCSGTSGCSTTITWTPAPAITATFAAAPSSTLDAIPQSDVDYLNALLSSMDDFNAGFAGNTSSPNLPGTGFATGRTTAINTSQGSIAPAQPKGTGAVTVPTAPAVSSNGTAFHPSGTGNRDKTTLVTMTAASSTQQQSSAPSCMADGAAWYSPSSWCRCGGSTYATLSATSGDKDGLCAYKTLPSKTISPVTTSAPPTNVPGMNGVPGCRAVVSDASSSAHCNCGGTLAPTLSPTSSGFMNCVYTTVPTSSYDPAFPVTTTAEPTTTTAEPAKPPYATGRCNIHVLQALGTSRGDPQVLIGANITDASGRLIGHYGSELDWSEPLDVTSELPYVLSVTPKSGIKSKRSASGSLSRRIAPPPPGRTLHENGPVLFAYGDQSWDTTSADCSVGAWDNGGAEEFFGTLIFGDKNFPTRQMDCKFDC